MNNWYHAICTLAQHSWPAYSVWIQAIDIHDADHRIYEMGYRVNNYGIHAHWQPDNITGDGIAIWQID